MGDANWADWVGLAFKVAGALATVLSLVFGWALWSLRREVVTRRDFAAWSEVHEKEHSDLEKRLADGDVRFARLETTLAHLPTRADMEDLRVEVTRVSGAVTTVGATIDQVATSINALSEQVQMLVSHHIKAGS